MDYINTAVAWLRANIRQVLIGIGAVVALLFVAQAAFGMTDEERAEYARFNNEFLVPSDCHPGEDYVFDIRALASAWGLHVAETGGAYGWPDGRNFIMHWELYSGGTTVFDADRIYVIGEDVETGEFCVFMMAKRETF